MQSEKIRSVPMLAKVLAVLSCFFPFGLSAQQGECSKRACVAVVDIVSEQPCEYFEIGRAHV